MKDLHTSSTGNPIAETEDEGLRQALLRMTKPASTALRENLEQFRAEFRDLSEEIKRAKTQILDREDGLARQDQELLAQIQRLENHQNQLEEKLAQLERDSRSQLDQASGQLHAELSTLGQSLQSPEENTSRLSPLLVPILHERAREDGVQFAEAVAPVIGPAIRHQIREARQDIIDALYPLIGQIIGKAISEAIRELTQKIDAQIRQQNQVQRRLNRFFNRLKGIPEAESALRDSLPYEAQRVFLIQRGSGLLIQYLSSTSEKETEADLIGSMLTAIRDFVHDSFESSQHELEEIVYGEQRILIENAQNVYLAVVISGTEPQGFHQLLRDTLNTLSLRYEKQLAGFNGEMEQLPNLESDLAPILAKPHVEESASPALSTKQKMGAAAGVLAVLLLLAALVLGCIFTVRLWPLVFR
jgi:ubiquinone biosynthesis protein UbiJ